MYGTCRPVLVVNDLELAKMMMVKDFDHFTDLRTFGMDTSTEANRYIANMMPFVTGEKWRKVRSLMTPAFTSGKLKNMVPLMQKVTAISCLCRDTCSCFKNSICSSMFGHLLWNRMECAF